MKKNQKAINIFERSGLKILNYADAAEIILHGNIIDDTDAEWLKLADDNIIGYCYPAKVREALDELAGKPIDVHIASDGGNVAAGVAIYNMLKQHDAEVNVYIDAWAASIASVIAMAGNKIYMPENAFLMVHNPSGGAFGDASYLRAVADWLEKLRDMIAETYAKRSLGNDKEAFLDLMDKETWLTANEAADLFPDVVEIIEDDNMLEAVACFSSLKNAPEALNAAQIEKAKAEAEAKAKAEAEAKAKAEAEAKAKDAAARIEAICKAISETVERSLKAL